MIISFQLLNSPANFSSTVNVYKSRASYGGNLITSMALQGHSVSMLTDDDKCLSESKRITSSNAALTRKQVPNSLLGHENTVGIIGGVSAFSTLVFLEKLIWLSSKKKEEECVPFVVCSDPAIKSELSTYATMASKRTKVNHEAIVENLRRKREFLEQSGAQCIVMPCHTSQVWHRELSEGCSVKFLNIGDCVARELKQARLKPLEAGSNVRIGVLAEDVNIYEETLQNEGFEVVLPDKPMMEHIIIPAVEALSKKDMEGARNLLRIAIQALLVKAASTVILASDELQGLLPLNDPLLKKCVDPMDALARSTVQWAHSSIEKANDNKNSVVAA